MTTQPFIHEQLENPAKQIRLLEFETESRFDDEVRLLLSIWDLDFAPPFNAISYTWGEDTTTETVFINGFEFQARHNCAYATRQTRGKYPRTHVWIDSICINQNPDATGLGHNEKGFQVRNMAAIYQLSSRVLACVGPHENGSGVLLGLPAHTNMRSAEAIENAIIRVSLADGLGESPPWSLFQDMVEHMTTRAYWKRLWIVQELAAGNANCNGTVVLCGAAAITKSQLDQLVAISGRAGWHYKQTMHIQLRTFHSLAHMLRTFGTFNCFDPRDRLYGILSLFNPKNLTTPVLPDYTKRRLDVAAQAYNMDSSIPPIELLKTFQIWGSELLQTSRKRRPRHSSDPSVNDLNNRLHASNALCLIIQDGYRVDLSPQHHIAGDEECDPREEQVCSPQDFTYHWRDWAHQTRNRIQIQYSRWKRLYGRGEWPCLVGLAPSEAMPGDILIPIRRLLDLKKLGPSSFESSLVLRKMDGKKNDYDVIGRSIHFHWSSSWEDWCTTPYSPLGRAMPLSSCSFYADVTIRLSFEDLLTVWFQIHSDHGNGSYLPTPDFLAWALTNPIANPQNAATLVVWSTFAERMVTSLAGLIGKAKIL